MFSKICKIVLDSSVENVNISHSPAVYRPATDANLNLDVQLAQLKKDMQHLRQQDMALLGHLLQIHQVCLANTRC